MGWLVRFPAIDFLIRLVQAGKAAAEAMFPVKTRATSHNENESSNPFIFEGSKLR